MAKKISPWLWGCGIGCGGLVIVAAAVIGGGYFFLRDTMSGFEEAIALRSRLEAEHGKPDAYIPPPTGAVPAVRMEAFLRVRELTQPARSEIVQAFETFPVSEEEQRELEEKPGLEVARRILGMVGEGLGLGVKIGRFMQDRNQALLDVGMGMGEYSYIYVLAYHSWLGHPPDEGPHSHNKKLKVDLPEVPGELRRRIVRIFVNQLEAVGAARNPTLAAEVSKLQDDPRRVPYADGLPPAIETSLSPYRDRLESTYSGLTNRFELSVNQSSSFNVDVF